MRVWGWQVELYAVGTTVNHFAVVSIIWRRLPAKLPECQREKLGPTRCEQGHTKSVDQLSSHGGQGKIALTQPTWTT
jgi:hypothetical protein